MSLIQNSSRNSSRYYHYLGNLEDLEVSGILTALREMSGILLKVRKMLGENVVGKMAKNCLLVAYLRPYRYLVASSQYSMLIMNRSVVQRQLPEADHSRHSMAATNPVALLRRMLRCVVRPLDVELHHHAT